MKVIHQGKWKLDDDDLVITPDNRIHADGRSADFPQIVNIPEQPIMPCVKWRVASGQDVVFAMEFDPQVYSIRWKPAKKRDNSVPEHRYQIAMPFVNIVSSFRHKEHCCSHVFFRNEPLSSIDDELFLSPLPNQISFDGRMCMADTAIDGVQDVYENWFGGQFNKNAVELNRLTNKLFDPRVTNFQDWQSATLEDPSFVMQLEWPCAASESDYDYGYRPTGSTLLSLVNRLLCGSQPLFKLAIREIATNGNGS